jgi:phage-related protein
LLTGLDHLYKNLYDCLMARLKPIEFRGGALEDLRAFPDAARRAAGFQLKSNADVSRMIGSP